MTYLATYLFYGKRDGVDRMTSYRTDLTEPPEKVLQESSTLPYRPEINLYAFYYALHDETTI